ncbi:MGMT family protein [Blastococcus goldschmidtiae]|uniref:MGMT family protein n=1 Tax=Blastococcus goldschmidtiae TaxID=3075546 RepID=A0ABU2K4U0_9ACTN|nr:MGMT family protein [Blastococcus sp. DSM 46792]MDT0275189.1 MGMT family protein [Blastococcus sp. DSM 46792]
MADPAPDPALDVDEAVFDAVEQIPPGRVSTYGAIGRLVGVGPRRVARALSSGGGAVPWFRVVRADGTAAEPVRARQLERLALEGVPVRNGRIDLSAVGWPDRDTDVVPRDDGAPSKIASREDARGRPRTIG